MGILSGLLGGINQTADQNRAIFRKEEDEQNRFERAELARIAESEAYQPEIRERAATALMDMASNPGKRGRGNFVDRLFGAGKVQPHEGVTQLMRFMQSGESKSLPSGLVETRPNPPAPAAAPPSTNAAMPPTPAGQPGGGPPSVSALGSPGGPQTAAPAPPAPTAQAATAPPQIPGGLPTGPIPVNESTGAGPQGTTAPVSVDRRIMRTPAEIAIEKAKAEALGDLQGAVEAWVAMGVPQDQAVAAVAIERDRRMRIARGGTNVFRAVALEIPDVLAPGGWRQIQGTFNAATGDYEDAAGNPLTNARPRQTTGSQSMGVDREAIARADFQGRRYVDLSPAEQQQVLRREIELTAAQAGASTTARAVAESNAPLSTQARASIEAGMRDDLQKHLAVPETMQAQYQIMRTALDRMSANPAARGGASESIRVTFEKILDTASVVREAEYNRQGLGLSAFSRLEGLYQKYVKGGGDIPDDVLREMVETARQYTVGARDRAEIIKQRFRDLATRTNVNPDNVLMTLGAGGPPPSNLGTINAPAPPPTVAPPVGMQGQGGSPLDIGPGQLVGNRYTGPIRMLPDGRFLGQVEGKTVVLTKAPDGSFKY